ncbi:MAG TPA: hypothetical protein VL049_07320 [Candidatus Dormibacteraeota bacterium]|nr:hypothetical protein [Candidatus Dormibacteraeota bacterium]
MLGRSCLLLLLLLASAARAIPATPLMTVYQFNGPEGVPYYDVDRFLRDGPSRPDGTLAQGTSVIPCLVVRAGRPFTDRDGTPYVGFEVVIDARDATPAATARFKDVAAQRKALAVANHHCPASTSYVIDARALFALNKAPSFDPPRPPTAAPAPDGSRLDDIVRAFHASHQCELANLRLMDRRENLARAWDAFIADNPRGWPLAQLRQARQLDYVMRTALYEGHLGRGCSAYGACERNVIALSIRNRALERCLRGQGCREDGDFEGVASSVAQYNIWDEFLTQTTGLTSCFLRPDLAGVPAYARLQAMYAQNVDEVEGILFGGEHGLQSAFPGEATSQLTRLRHYYHPPAMGKCFPGDPRLEYISAAVAERSGDFALIANTRIRVDEPSGGGYHFRVADVEDLADRDVVHLADRYPGFVIDGRKVELKRQTGCTPYGTPPGCRFATVGRHRKTPRWLAGGDPLQITCRVRASDEACGGPATTQTVAVGGVCDTAMQPVAGVP